MMKKAILVAFLSLVIKTSTAEWTSPFFKDLYEGISLEYVGTNYVGITMDEEIPWPFTVGKLDGYDGTQSPEVIQDIEGNFGDLGLTFSRNGSEWEMVITKRQDYEHLKGQPYTFEIQAGINVLVDLHVRNIFDNRPIVDILDNSCVVPELEEANYTSSCKYRITDPDGYTNNRIRFEIDGNYNESDLFKFVMEEGQNDEYIRTFSLVVRKTLDYDERSFYAFGVTVYDAGNNSESFNVVVRVEDMPNKPPMWTRVFASAQFDEKTEQEFETEAIDGDIGIRADICYKLSFEIGQNYSDLISINRTTGKIHVNPIDRDTLKIEIFPFFITAYECDDPEWNITNAAVLVVNDINDHVPEIFFSIEKNTVSFYEETLFTLFEFGELIVNDIDLGRNALYEVVLSPQNYAAPFSLVPKNGYQEQNFTINVIEPSTLDYEDPVYRNFSLTIIAEEIDNTTHRSEKVFEVVLINWNDELPQFLENEYTFQVNETVGENFEIGFVEAEDRDVDDSIEYFLIGAILQKIAVNLTTGLLSTVVNDAFDYEQQQEVIFQVFARDTLQTDKNESTHTTSAQVRINVLDINDTPPSFSLPMRQLSVIENTTDQIITNEIVVYDPDTTASLNIFIDWEASLAVGVDVDKSDYVGCVELVINEISNNQANVTVQVNNSHLIDYEKFQLLFLTITAVDENTQVNQNSTSALLTIAIEDINDNEPKFVGDTLEVRRSVMEESRADTIIGYINAIDIDGPENNEILYSLIALDPDINGWVKINNKTGEISVDQDETIDCDDPPRETLDYIVHLADGRWNTTGNVSIIITDINNKIPELNDFEKNISIYENATDVQLTIVDGFDKDRDDPHNVLQYYINFQNNPELQRYFEVNSSTGELRVKMLNENNQLDRDHEPSTYSITINVEDNRGIGLSNRINTTVTVILLDVNDNAPEMPKDLSFSLSVINENITEGTVLVDQFYAPDIDEGVNAEVTYEIISIEPIEVENVDIEDYENLFTLENYANKFTRILAGTYFKGFSGKWNLTIMATDRGYLGDSGYSQNSTASYSITINAVNFNEPTIVFPAGGSIFRLDFMQVGVGRTLRLLNSSMLVPFEAVDDDVGTYGDVTFTLDSNGGDHEHFTMIKLNKKQSELQVVNEIEEKIYSIILVARDGGNFQSRETYLSLAFINPSSQPYFESNELNLRFTETEIGLTEERIIPEAIDVKNVGVTNEDEIYEIFYFVDDTYEDGRLFNINSSTRVLTLKEELDRLMNDRHFIRIIATNQDAMPNPQFVSNSSFLFITIDVDDVNNHPPTFAYKNYSVGISESDNRGKILVTLNATDPDLDDIITFFIIRDTIMASSEQLSVIAEPFQIDKDTGVLTLNFRVTESMSGYFEFEVEARDLVNHTDRANVKIFIVADSNRVPFTFLNTTSEVQSANQSALALIFSEVFEADCVIDEISPVDTDASRSRVFTHFVRNSEAIINTEIMDQLNDPGFLRRLYMRLSVELNLELTGIENEQKDINYGDSKTLEIALYSTVGVLTVLLLVVSTLYILQFRNYSRQIKALSAKTLEPNSEIFKNTKALPNTNIYSEGKQINPVLMSNFNNGSDLDTKSIISEESDDFGNLNDTNIFDISSSVEKRSTFA